MVVFRHDDCQRLADDRRGQERVIVAPGPQGHARLLRNIRWRCPAMPRCQKGEQLDRPHSLQSFSPRPGVQDSCTCVGAGFELAKAIRIQHLGQGPACGVAERHPMNRTAKSPGQRCGYAVHLFGAQRAVMPVLARNHHAHRRHDIPECHGLRSLGRKPGSGRDQSPLPFRQAPFRIKDIAPAQVQLIKKFRHRHGIKRGHSCEPRRQPLVCFGRKDDRQTAIPCHTGSPRTARSFPAPETSPGMIRSSPLSMAAIASCDMTEKMPEVMPPVTLRIRVSTFSSIWL